MRLRFKRVRGHRSCKSLAAVVCRVGRFFLFLFPHLFISFSPPCHDDTNCSTYYEQVTMRVLLILCLPKVVTHAIIVFIFGAPGVSSRVKLSCFSFMERYLMPRRMNLDGSCSRRRRPVRWMPLRKVLDGAYPCLSCGFVGYLCRLKSAKWQGTSPEASSLSCAA